ncbi:hypothetical protein K7X08_017386 [Anisodus acutangulus]|uniref:FBD domain-containing protein n=1 Tax=Anisodus acutangulus TaxID=402998 RepID=A0A9Q1LY91_9SOLA|nr:hypothetical protein K7X08_017386 [Anisodus acutangulus]
MQTVPKQSVYIKWHPPATNVIKRNVDGAASTNNNKHLIMLINSPFIQHLYWEQNFLADKMAHLGMGSACDTEASLQVFVHPPTTVVNTLPADKIGTSFQRKMTMVPGSTFCNPLNSVDASPNDELLDPVTGDDVDETSASFSDVTLNHLRTVKFIRITGTKPEMELIKLLLEKSPTLVRMEMNPVKQESRNLHS